MVKLANASLDDLLAEQSRRKSLGTSMAVTDIPDQETIDLPTKPITTEPTTTVARRLGDVGISALKGAISVPEAAVGLLDIPTFGYAGKAAEAVGFQPGEAKTILEDLYSPAQKQANRNVAEAKGFIDTAKTMATNPSTIAHGVIEALPAMGAGGVVARGIKTVAGAGTLVASALGEGAVGAGLTAEQIRQQNESGLLDKKEAASSVAAGALTSVFNLVGGRIAKSLGIDDIDTLAAGAAREGSQTAGDVGRKIIAGGISEGVFEELPQSAQEQIWMNVATEKPMLEGVPEASAAGLMIGGAMGSGANISRPDAKAPTKSEAAKALEPVMELRKANLPNEKLDILSNNPEALQEFGVTKEDVDALRIERVLDKDEQVRFKTLLDTAPNPAVKRGILDSLQGEVYLRRGQLEEAREPKTKTESEKRVDEFTTPTMSDKAIQEVKESPEYPISTEAQDQLDAYADDLVANKTPLEELKAERTKTINNLEASLANLSETDSVETQALAAEAVEINRRQLEILDDIITPTQKAEPLKFGEVPSSVEGMDRRQLTEEVAEDRREGDRRVDTERRKRIDEMTPEEMKTELLTNELTRIPNKRAFDEAVAQDEAEGKESSIVFMDADSLKYINDNLGGHEAGDKLLTAIAGAVQEVAGEKGFHVSGDEFLIKATNDKEAETLIEQVNTALADTELVFNLEDGSQVVYTGPGVSYGIAKTKAEADKRMAESKAKREEAGLRAKRGERPAGLSEVTTKQSEGRADTAAKEEVAPAEPVKPAKPEGPVELSEAAQAAPIGKLVGRKTASDIVDPATNEVIIKKGVNLTEADINTAAEIGYKNIPVTSGKAKKTTPKKIVKKSKKAAEQVASKKANKKARLELINERVELKKKQKDTKQAAKKVKTQKTKQIEKELDEDLLLYNREGVIDVYDDASQLPSEVARALEKDESDPLYSIDGGIVGVYHKGKIHLLSNKIKSTKDVKGLVAHEGGHFMRRQDSWFQKNYDDLFSQFISIAEGSRSSKEARAAQAAIEKAVGLGDSLTPELIQEEAFMYFMQDQANAKYTLWQKAVDLVRRWVFKAFKRSAKQMNLSGRDMANMLIRDIQAKLADKSTIEPTESDVPLASRIDDAKKVSDEARKILEDVYGSKTPVEEEPDNFYNDAIEIGIKSTDKFTKKFSQLTKDILSDSESNPADFRRGDNEQTSRWYERLFSSPEYYFRKDATAARIVHHAQEANDRQFEWEHKILDDFIDVSEGIKKSNRKAYNKANAYVLDVDQTGKGFSLAPSEEGEGWDVLGRNDEIIETYENEQEAVDAMIEAEQQYLVTKWFNKDARRLIKYTRELANRGFDISIADMRRQIENALQNDQPEPLIKYKDDEGKAKEITLSEAIAKMGDLRGTYFPRERQNKAVIVRGEKEGSPNELHTFDVHWFENTKGIRPVEAFKKSFNKATPSGRKVRELERRGFSVSVKPAPTPSDVIFDVPGLLTSMDAILSAAESQLKTDEEVKKEEAKLMEEINKQLTTKIADIYKAKSNFSSRKKRAESLWTGYEEDLSKAFTSYSRRVAAGAAKRETARRMLMSFTGRDIPFNKWQETHPNGTYTDYRAFVKERAIDPTTQKNLYNDVRQYISHVIKPDDRANRVIGYLKALAVLKFLALRVSSAAVNMTNMAAAVPATIAGHTGQSLTRSWGDIGEAATKYGIYRARGLKNYTDAETLSGVVSEEDKWIFDRISELGWDEAQFNHDAAKVINDWAGDTWNWIMEKGMYMFGATEKANRAMTIFAAYKAHERTRPGLNPEQLLKLAKHASDRAHGTYGKTAKPWWVQKYPPLDLLYTFQKFQHNYALNALELGMSKKDWKASTHMLLAPGVLAGAGASILTKILAAIWPGDDPEEEFYNWVDEQTGEGSFSSKFARHGIAGAAFGVNLKGSLQMNNPFPTKPEELAGATGGIAKDMWNGFKHLKRGEFDKAKEDFSPTAIGSIFKGIREAREGVTTKDYAPVYYGTEPLKAGTTEKALRYFSFNPTRISSLREKQWREDKVRREYGILRSDIKAKILHHIAKFGRTNQEGLNKILKEIDEYNNRVYRSHPRYQNIYIDNKWLNSTLKRAYTPKKTERQRVINKGTN